MTDTIASDVTRNKVVAELTAEIADLRANIDRLHAAVDAVTRERDAIRRTAEADRVAGVEAADMDAAAIAQLRGEVDAMRAAYTIACTERDRARDAIGIMAKEIDSVARERDAAREDQANANTQAVIATDRYNAKATECAALRAKFDLFDGVRRELEALRRGLDGTIRIPTEALAAKCRDTVRAQCDSLSVRAEAVARLRALIERTVGFVRVPPDAVLEEMVDAVFDVKMINRIGNNVAQLVHGLAAEEG